MEVEIEKNLLAQNDRLAQENKQILEQAGVFAFDIVGSPGSGKTALLEHLLDRLGREINLAVIEGDLYTRKDAERLEGYDSEVIQINTQGACHLEALSIQQALRKLDLEELDGLIIENVGNLVCPASFALGTAVTITVLSVPEGNDKPLKYPALFEQSRAVVINKIDLVAETNFSLTEAETDLEALNPKLELFPLSCSSGRGLKEFCTYLKELMQDE